MRQGLDHRAAPKEIQPVRETHPGDGGWGDTYVPSEANTVFPAEARFVESGVTLVPDGDF